MIAMTNQISEYKFKKNTKLVEAGFYKWDVLYEGEVIGTVEKSHRGYKAVSKAGRYIGSGNSKHQAKWFVAQDFVGTDNIAWKDQ